MASNGWRSDTPLGQLLSEKCHKFNFFQVVRLLEKQTGASLEDEDIIEFSSSLGDEFNAGAVQGLEYSPDDDKPKLSVSVNGLTGPKGPMPVSFSRWAQNDRRYESGALADFFDLFNHKLIRLAYLAKQRNSLALQNKAPDESWLAKRAEGICGLSDLIDRLPLSKRFLIGMTGLLGNIRPSHNKIVKTLRAFLRVPVALSDHIGEWQTFSVKHHAKLGMGRLNTKTQVPLLLGKKHWLQQARLKLIVGPLHFDDYLKFLPGKSQYNNLVALLALLTDCRWTINMLLKVRYASIPRAYLPVSSDIANGEDAGFRLGSTSWLKSRDDGDNENVDAEKSINIVLTNWELRHE